MPKDKTESHEKLIPAAKEEFLEKGFQNASIRSIAAKVGMTSAGLYRHFKDKEDMFASLVEPALNEAREWVCSHMKRGYEGLDSGNYALMWQDNEIDLLRKIIYPNKDAFRLILCCAQGTRYENFVDDIVNENLRSMLDVFEKLREKGVPAKKVSEEELHIILTAYVHAMFEPIIHNFEEEKAVHYLKIIEEFFMPGWHNLLGC